MEAPLQAALGASRDPVPSDAGTGGGYGMMPGDGMTRRWRVTVAGEQHVFDDAVLCAEDGAEARRAVLAELLRWGMIVAAAELAHRGADSAYRNWRGTIYCQLAPQERVVTPEWKFKARVDMMPEFPIMKERLANAEAAAAQARAIRDALQRRIDLLVNPPGQAAPEGSREIAVEQCEPGLLYLVSGRAMTYVGVGSSGACFRDHKGKVCLALEAKVMTFGGGDELLPGGGYRCADEDEE